MSRSASVVPAVTFLCATCLSTTWAAPPSFDERAAQANIAVLHDMAPSNHANYPAGGAVGDFNNDGWQDILWLSGGGGSTPDKLFINNQDGTFSDLAGDWGVDALHAGRGAAVGDINHDGFLDIYVTSAGPPSNIGPGHNRLYLNNSGTSFTDISSSAGVNTVHPTQDAAFGASFGDYDLDGDLDLYVAGIEGAASHRLFRNEGDDTFTDVTSESFSPHPNGFGFTPCLIDTDGDFYPELLLVSDFGTSSYYRNNRNGTFTEVSGSSGTTLEENGMGSAVGDYDNDGLIDWYATSIWFNNPGFTGNKLYDNKGAHEFEEIASAAGVDVGGYGWAALMIDFNNDGRLDIAGTAGDGGGSEPSYLWMHDDTLGSFTEMAQTAGFIHGTEGRGMAALDFDNDGDMDVVIFANNGMFTLFENLVSGPDTGWLRVFLDTTATPLLAPNGYGAHVEISIDGNPQHRWISGGDHYLSHSELSAHFGLGAATVVDMLKVTFPDGSIRILSDVPGNQTITLAPAECDLIAQCADVDEDGIRDDNCMWTTCSAGDCDSTPIVYADMGGQFGACGADGTADGNDRFHALNCFADTDTEGGTYPCENNPPQALFVDAGGPFGNCAADGVCDGNDAFHALNRFEGTSTCSCPLDGSPAPETPQKQEPDRTATLALTASTRTVSPGELISVDAWLMTPLRDLRGYQLHVTTAGGHSGYLELVDISVRQPDRARARAAHPVFGRLPSWKAFNIDTHQVLVGLDTPGVAVGQGYLSTFTFKASSQASGTFTIELLSDHTDPAQRTFLFATAARDRILIDPVALLTIEVD